jgi:hypothetical protein
MTGCGDIIGALGAAAAFGNAPPEAAIDTACAIGLEQPRQALALSTFRLANHPVVARHGLIQPQRKYAAHAVAEFAAIDANERTLALQGPGLRASTAIRDWELRQAGPTPQQGTAISQNGGRIQIGYVFFEDRDSSSDPVTKSASFADGYVFTDAEGKVQSLADNGTISGEEAASEVNGDNIDPLLKSYDRTPDVLLSRGGITLSGGYSSVEGVSIGGKIARQNIGGANREIAASARYSKVRQLLEIGYADGNFLGGTLGFAPSLFAQRTSAKGFGNGLRTTRFAQGAYGLNLSVSRKFGARLSASASYRLSVDSFRMRGKEGVCDASFFGSPLCNAIGRRTTSLLSGSLAFDRRERNANSMRGFRLRFAQDIGIGGSAPFARTRIGGEAHVGLGDDWTLMFDAEGGYLAPMGKGAIPLFERFYAGDTSLRGFDLRGVGPKVRPTGAVHGQNVAIGGRAYYAARAEISGTLGGFLERHGVQPSLFIDAGSVFGANRHRLAAGETLLGNSAKPRVSAGIGLAMKTPAGTLRFDIARPLLKQPGDRTKTFSIGFSAAV